jgi:hypothetical protein
MEKDSNNQNSAALAPSPSPAKPKLGSISISWKWILAGAIALIIILFVFMVGAFVGYHKADFSFRWAENYHRNFGGPRGGFLQDLEGRDFISGHGIAGTVIKVESNSLVVKDGSGVEKTFMVTEKSTIKQGMDTVKLSDIAVDNRVVIIGTPKDDGTIEAELIRVFDGSEQMPQPSLFPRLKLF